MPRKLLCKFGSDKTGDDTLLLNMGSAVRCPSRARCRVLLAGQKCYPDQVERLHPVVKSFRDLQEAYWRDSTAEQIVSDILEKIDGREPPTRYLRFNESGDFWSQACVDKLSQVAEALRVRAGIVTYGFTARDDLDFSQARFLVKGSGHDCGNNGRSIVVGSAAEVPQAFVLCPEDCRTCNICMSDTQVDIAFIER
tara:strand:+ start:1609 stop:2196 length:588 start_codon:yes stop_codon:yes gene_type:complete